MLPVNWPLLTPPRIYSPLGGVNDFYQTDGDFRILAKKSPEIAMTYPSKTSIVWHVTKSNGLKL
jgi:hypothetical protein